MVFAVYAGDLGQDPKSKQQMFNQLSRQRAARGEGSGRRECSQWMPRKTDERWKIDKVGVGRNWIERRWVDKTKR